MTLGTNLITDLLNFLVEKNKTDRRFRKLICESGPAGRKAYRFVKPKTRKAMVEAFQKCDGRSKYKVSFSTFVLILHTLHHYNEEELINRVTRQGGNNARAALDIFLTGKSP